MSATGVDAPIAAATSRRPAARRSRRDAYLVVALVALKATIALPYLLRGPKLLMDDFAFSAGGRFIGVGHAAEYSDRFGRPMAFLINNLEFGGIGPHPLPLYLLQVAVGAAVAVSLFVVAKRFLPIGWAVAVAAT